MRIGQRYLLVKISGGSGAKSPEELERLLEAEVQRLMGSAGMGRSGYKFVRQRRDGGGRIEAWEDAAVIKTTIDGLLPVRAALCLISSIGGKPAKADVLRVSGTIKGALRGKE